MSSSVVHARWCPAGGTAGHKFECSCRPVGAVARLLDALWQCGVWSGMDTDGAEGPGAMVAGMGIYGFAAAMVEQVHQLRLDYDEALDEVGERKFTQPINPDPVTALAKAAK